MGFLKEGDFLPDSHPDFKDFLDFIKGSHPDSLEGGSQEVDFIKEEESIS